MAILKLKDAEGKIHEIVSLRGDPGAKGETYTITEQDYSNIAEVAITKEPVQNALNKADAAFDNAETAILLAKQINSAKSYKDYLELVEDLNTATAAKYQVGCSFWIVEQNVPDLWISEIVDNYIEYNYIDNKTLVDELKANQIIQIGYYKLAMLETLGLSNGEVITPIGLLEPEILSWSEATCMYQQGGAEAKYAIDGLDTTLWSAGYNKQNPITLTLAKPANLTNLTIKWGGKVEGGINWHMGEYTTPADGASAASSYAVYVSPTLGENDWVTIREMAERENLNVTLTDEIPVNSVLARRIKIEINSIYDLSAIIDVTATGVILQEGGVAIYNLDNGVYRVSKNVSLKYNNFATVAENCDCYLIVASGNAVGHKQYLCFASSNSNQPMFDMIYCGDASEELGTSYSFGIASAVSANKRNSFTEQQYFNSIVQFNKGATFNDTIPTIELYIDDTDNSTSIPNTRWVQSKLDNLPIQGGEDIFQLEKMIDGSGVLWWL